jgi:RimJ/RimL family protein N-acetyltransferase
MEPVRLMTVSLRKITEADAYLLVQWRNENAQFFPKQAPFTVESHLRWYRDSYMTDPAQNMFMVLLDSRPIGCLAMTIRDGRGELERMILGDKTVTRGGHMRAGFRQLMDTYGLASYWLRIYEWNTVTIAFHKRNGFEITGKSAAGEYLIMERDGRQPWPTALSRCSGRPAPTSRSST